jgi:regulator of replication initiation timing
VAQANEFKVTLPIEGEPIIRSFSREEGREVERALSSFKPGESLPDDGVIIVEGIASDTSRDQLNGKMSERAILHMVECINAPVFHSVERAEASAGARVGIDIDHSGHWTDQIGQATKGWARYELTEAERAAGFEPPVLGMRAEIDLGMSHGRDLARAQRRGARLGLSVYGTVLRAHNETLPDGTVVEHFDLVQLKRVAVTSRPVNRNTWLKEVKRSFAATMNEENTTQETEVTPDAPETLADVISALGEQVRVVTADGTEVTPEGEPVAETAPEPAPEAAPEASETATEVARSEGEGEEGTPTPAEAVTEEAAPTADSAVAPESDEVARAFSQMESAVTVVRSEIEEMRRSMSALPGVLELVGQDLKRALEEIEALRTENEELRRSLDERASEAAELSRRLETVEEQPMGRKGLVARSMTQAQAPDGTIVPAEQAGAIIKGLMEKGETAAAALALYEASRRPAPPYAGGRPAATLPPVAPAATPAADPQPEAAPAAEPATDAA